MSYSSIHDLLVWSSYRTELILYRPLRFSILRFIHFLKYEEVQYLEETLVVSTKKIENGM